MRALKIRGLLIIALTLLLVAISGCASTRQNPWAEKRKKASHVTPRSWTGTGIIFP